MFYKFITNPITNKRIPINSISGKYIFHRFLLHNIINQEGGNDEPKQTYSQTEPISQIKEFIQNTKDYINNLDELFKIIMHFIPEHYRHILVSKLCDMTNKNLRFISDIVTDRTCGAFQRALE